MTPLLLVISLLFFIAILFLGLFLFSKPGLTIELQRRFYEKINWRIEPISVPKEIRNTRIMGLFLVLISILTTAYVFGGYLNG